MGLVEFRYFGRMVVAYLVAILQKKDYPTTLMKKKHNVVRHYKNQFYCRYYCGFRLNALFGTPKHVCLFMFQINSIFILKSLINSQAYVLHCLPVPSLFLQQQAIITQLLISFGPPSLCEGLCHSGKCSAYLQQPCQTFTFFTQPAYSSM